MPKMTKAQILAQPHRANPANPAMANCAMWLSPEQLEQRHTYHLAAGRVLASEVPCICGNHTRRVYL